MSIDLLLGRLEGVRRTGPSTWRARCPAHEGKSLTLSVRAGDDDRTLLHCFAGCELSEILAAAGLQVSDLFPRHLDQHRYPPTRSRMPAAEALALLSHEVLVASLIICDVLKEKKADADQWQRLSLASTRISEARSQSCPARVPKEAARAS